MYELTVADVRLCKGPFYNHFTDVYDRYDVVNLQGPWGQQGWRTTPNPYWGDGVHYESLQHIAAAVRNPRKFRFYVAPSTGSMGTSAGGTLHIVPR